MDKNIRNIANISSATMNQNLSGYGFNLGIVKKDSLSSNFSMKNFNSVNMNRVDSKYLSGVLSTGLSLPDRTSALFSNSSN
jgi:hypothetical protein